MQIAGDSFDHIHSLLKRGRRADALRALVDLDQMRIHSPYSSDLNHAWYLVGDIFYRKKKFLEARRAFLNALRHWPNDVHCRMAIANCYSELQRPRWAAFHLVKALRLERGDPGLMYNLGNAYFDLGKYALASRQYQKAQKATKGHLAKMCKKNLGLINELKTKRASLAGRKAVRRIE